MNPVIIAKGIESKDSKQAFMQKSPKETRVARMGSQSLWALFILVNSFTNPCALPIDQWDIYSSTSVSGLYAFADKVALVVPDGLLIYNTANSSWRHDTLVGRDKIILRGLNKIHNQKNFGLYMQAGALYQYTENGWKMICSDIPGMISIAFYSPDSLYYSTGSTIRLIRISSGKAASIGTTFNCYSGSSIMFKLQKKPAALCFNRIFTPDSAWSYSWTHFLNSEIGDDAQGPFTLNDGRVLFGGTKKIFEVLPDTVVTHIDYKASTGLTGLNVHINAAGSILVIQTLFFNDHHYSSKMALFRDNAWLVDSVHFQKENKPFFDIAENGTIWHASQSGPGLVSYLYRIRDNVWDSIPIPEKVPLRSPRSIRAASKDMALIDDYYHLGIATAQGDFISYDSQMLSLLRRNTVKPIIRTDSSGTLYFLDTNRNIRKHGIHGEDQIIKSPRIGFRSHVFDLCTDGSLFLKCDDTLFQWGSAGWSVARIGLPMVGDELKMMSASSGYIISRFVNSIEKVFHFTLQGIDSLYLPLNCNSYACSPTAVYFSSKDSIFTWQDGALKRLQIPLLKALPGYTRNQINDLAVGPDGDLWVLHEDGILRYSNTGDIDTMYGRGQFRWFGSIDVSPDGGVWITFSGGIARLETKISDSRRPSAPRMHAVTYYGDEQWFTLNGRRIEHTGAGQFRREQAHLIMVSKRGVSIKIKNGSSIVNQPASR
jgi:hypothetical protein